MTVVDSRGRRTPADAKGRTFSGPPPRSARPTRLTAAPSAAAGRAQRHGNAPGGTEFRAPSRRPGAAALWTVALAGCLVAAIVQGANHATGYSTIGVGYVIAAPLAIGLVRRGRDLVLLMCCLPLVFVVAASVGSAVILDQGGFPVTGRAIAQEVGQQLVLHPAGLWAGTVLALLIALRRGFRHRR